MVYHLMNLVLQKEQAKVIGKIVWKDKKIPEWTNNILQK